MAPEGHVGSEVMKPFIVEAMNPLIWCFPPPRRQLPEQVCPRSGKISRFSLDHEGFDEGLHDDPSFIVAAMDSPTIRRLRTEWQAIGTTPQSSAACHRLAQCEPVVDRLEVDNLAELVTALSLSSGRLSRNEAAEVITAMLRSADVDALVPRAIIEALIPGLLALPRRFDLAEGPWCDLDAFHADAVSALWELTISWSGTHRPYAAGDLLVRGPHPAAHTPEQ